MNLKYAILPVIMLFSAGCATEKTTTATSHHSAASDDGNAEPMDKHPRVGMSKGQIRQMYGEPDNINHSTRGEVWTYWFNKGAAFIPYNFGYKQRNGVFVFDDNGRLKDFTWNE